MEAFALASGEMIEPTIDVDEDGNVTVILAHLDSSGTVLGRRIYCRCGIIKFSGICPENTVPHCNCRTMQLECNARD
jgi:hypothetical protein